MKITPLEIRQKTFEKIFRGYDKDEVTAFLQSLSQEWEQVQEEVKELRLRNEAAEKEIKQLREVENSLFKTLKTAEDTGANMIDQATKTAELHMRETQMNADALLNEAKSKARATIDNAEARARGILEKMDQDMQSLKMEYRSLENLRDIIISELRNLSNDTLSRIDKIEAKAAQDATLVKERMAATAAAIAEEMETEESRARGKKVSGNTLKAAPVADNSTDEIDSEESQERPVDGGEYEGKEDSSTPEEDNNDIEDSTIAWSGSSEEETDEDEQKMQGQEYEDSEGDEVESEDEDSSFFDQIK